MALYHVRVAATVLQDYAVIANFEEEARLQALDSSKLDDLGGACGIKRTVIFCEKEGEANGEEKRN